MPVVGNDGVVDLFNSCFLGQLDPITQVLDDGPEFRVFLIHDFLVGELPLAHFKQKQLAVGGL